MAQADSTVSCSHIAVDIPDNDDDDSPPSSSHNDCAVCMEPAFWVVVGACGHGDVCLPCAVVMRFFQDDRRCCICRALCDTVVVVKAAARDDSIGGSPRQHAVFSSELASPAPAAVCPRWYHGGTAAYFDDRELYEEVSNICSSSKPYLHQQEDVDGDDRPDEEESSTHEEEEDAWLLLINFVAISFSGALAGIPFAMLLKHWLAKVTAVVACVLLMMAFMCYIPPSDSEESDDDAESQR